MQGLVISLFDEKPTSQRKLMRSVISHISVLCFTVFTEFDVQFYSPIHLLTYLLTY